MNNRDLISQYVDTGLRISDHQIKKLPNNLFKTYMRKRLIATKRGSTTMANSLSKFELSILNKDTLTEYLNNRIAYGFFIKDYEFDLLNDKLRIKLATERAKNGNHINDGMFKLLSDNDKKAYINNRIERENPMSNLMLQYGGKEVTNNYIDNQIKKEFRYSAAFQRTHGPRNEDGTDSYSSWFMNLSFELRVLAFSKMIDYVIKEQPENGFKYIHIEDEYYSHLGPNRVVWARSRIKNSWVSKEVFKDLNDKERMEYAEAQYAEDGGKWLPDYLKPYVKNYSEL